jgi:hypothetical protein
MDAPWRVHGRGWLGATGSGEGEMAEASRARSHPYRQRLRHDFSFRALWVTLIAGALWLLSAAPASANFVVPLLYLVWPAAWVLLLPIILLEARAAVRVLRLPFRAGLKVAAGANLVSTALGVPVCWFLVADAGFPTDWSVLALNTDIVELLARLKGR